MKHGARGALWSCEQRNKRLAAEWAHLTSLKGPCLDAARHSSSSIRERKRNEVGHSRIDACMHPLPSISLSLSHTHQLLAPRAPAASFRSTQRQQKTLSWTDGRNGLCFFHMSAGCRAFSFAGVWGNRASWFFGSSADEGWISSRVEIRTRRLDAGTWGRERAGHGQVSSGASWSSPSPIHHCRVLISFVWRRLAHLRCWTVGFALLGTSCVHALLLLMFSGSDAAGVIVIIMPKHMKYKKQTINKVKKRKEGEREL